MFNAEELLLPISPDQPCGADMAFSAELDAIAQARKFDDPSLEQGEWVTELKEADWDFVVKRCSALLAGKTKDLRLAVWLAEAAAKQFQLRGLGEGFSLLAGLVERYWDQGLYPEAEDGDQEQRIGNLAWILSRTRALVREAPLTQGRGQGPGSGWSTIDFEAARKRASSGIEPEGLPRLAEMEAARRANPSRFTAAFHADAQYCLDALGRLEQAADAQLGQDSPGFSSAREAVQGMLHALPLPAGAAPSVAAQPDAAAQAADAGAGADASAHAAPSSAAAGAGADAQPAPAGAPGPIRSRAQAIAQLRAVAEFFRETEPHSPVSYFAEKAANAGEQDLHTWLRSVIKDQGSLAHIEELLGVPPSN
ncbi:type VI secretion system protein TssA [Massilia forsythiae]|uniref:Type VI secretion system protein TssA n=1 Tax=Massilia forsythiae TaxID=2728020 RepID=A0A7Z2ZU42_9BURK|nr:type VI secretion system protein TssA [Massilia forsythiae]QJE02034.1 type VI secretion system protein TssA [Massilia forsythiae]